MEDLREKVYECTLAVEAHMICDLLARAGISARVDGEFLAGAGGERILRPYRRDPACAHGIQRSTDVYDEGGLRIVARQHFNAAWNDSPNSTMTGTAPSSAASNTIVTVCQERNRPAARGLS